MRNKQNVIYYPYGLSGWPQKKRMQECFHGTQPSTTRHVQIDRKGYFDGYASIFNVVDFHGDRVMPGAFTQTLKEHKHNKTAPHMLWQHQDHEVIGKWHCFYEDKKGLWVSGRLLLELKRAQEAYLLIKSGIMTSLSIGYYPVATQKCLRTKNRLLYKVNLVEVSLVSFGANPNAQIYNVKKYHQKGLFVPKGVC